MTDRIIQGWDITSVNYASHPATGQAMFYGTGTPDIKATPQMMSDYPFAVMTDQSPMINGTDTRLDVYDAENGALTFSELPEVIRDAHTNRLKRTRPQRFPLVYASDDNIPQVTGILRNASLQGYCGLFVAHWGIPYQQCVSRILSASGDFPVRAMQNLNAGAFDRDLFSLEWLATSGQWNHSWTCHTQRWTLGELAQRLGIPVNALQPGNHLALTVVTAWQHEGNHLMLIPQNAHFTYQKLPDTI